MGICERCNNWPCACVEVPPERDLREVPMPAHPPRYESTHPDRFPGELVPMGATINLATGEPIAHLWRCDGCGKPTPTPRAPIRIPACTDGHVEVVLCVQCVAVIEKRTGRAAIEWAAALVELHRQVCRRAKW